MNTPEPREREISPEDQAIRDKIAGLNLHLSFGRSEYADELEQIANRLLKENRLDDGSRSFHEIFFDLDFKDGKFHKRAVYKIQEEFPGIIKGIITPKE